MLNILLIRFDRPFLFCSYAREYDYRKKQINAKTAIHKTHKAPHTHFQTTLYLSEIKRTYEIEITFRGQWAKLKTELLHTIL